MLRKNVKCYGCVYFQKCNLVMENKCSINNYFLFATKEDAELCDIMCGDIEGDIENEID